MGPLVVHCPKTCQVINTGVDTEYKSLARSWDETITVQCLHCNEKHEIKVRDAYIRGELSDFKLPGR